MSKEANDPIAIIPARGGSKRIPRKNIRPFHGRPLISWSIRNLLESGIFSRVVVSTDDREVASISVDYGAEVPFLRPRELSDDRCPTAPVARHAIQHLIERGVSEESLFCLVYPAAVAVRTKDLVESKALIEKQNFDLVFAGCEFLTPPERGWQLGQGNVATATNPESQSLSSNELTPMYHDAGQFYWSRKSTWDDLVEGRQIRRGLYVMPHYRAIDINTEVDWILAESFFGRSLEFTD